MADLVKLVLTAEDKTGPGILAGLDRLKNLHQQAAVAAAAVGAAAVATAAALAAMTKKTIDNFDAAAKAAQTSGVSVEAFTSLAHAADLSGVSADGLKTAFAQLSKEVEAGGKGLAKLGVSIQDTSGRLKSNDQLMLDIAERFKGMADGAQKTALAMDIFGKAGGDLIPLLNSGADGIEKMQQQARMLGLEISTNAAKNAEAFNDNLTLLKASVIGAANTFTEHLLPTLVELSDQAVQFVTDGDKMRATLDAVAKSAKVTASGFHLLAAGGKAYFMQMARTAEAYEAMRKGHLLEAARAATHLKDDIEKIFAETTEKVAKLWEDMPAPKVKPPEIEGLAKATVDAHLKLGLLEFDPKAVERAATMVPMPEKTLNMHLRLGLLEADPNLEKTLAQTKAALARISDAYTSVTGNRLELIEKERRAELDKLGGLILNEEELARAREQIHAVYDSRRDEEIKKVEAAEEQKLEIYRRAEEQRTTIMEAGERARHSLIQGLKLESMDNEFERDREAASAKLNEQAALIESMNFAAEEGARAQFLAYQVYQRAMTSAQKAEEQARRSNMLTSVDAAGSMLGSLASLAQTFNKKNLGMYKALSISQATIAALVGATRAYADLPWPASGWVSAAILAAGMANVAQISQVEGAAHGGLEFVPKESTYLLDRGERVLSPKQNQDVTEMAENFNQGRGGGSQMISLTINLDGRPLWQGITDASRNGELIIDARAIA